MKKIEFIFKNLTLFIAFVLFALFIIINLTQLYISFFVFTGEIELEEEIPFLDIKAFFKSWSEGLMKTILTLITGKGIDLAGKEVVKKIKKKT